MQETGEEKYTEVRIKPRYERELKKVRNEDV